MKEIKISKLFHLLYATLLLAPVFAVGVACAQTAFTGNGFVVEEQNVYKESTSIKASEMQKDTWYMVDTSNLTKSYGASTLFGVADLVLWEELNTQKPIYMRNLDALSIEYNADLTQTIAWISTYNPAIETNVYISGIPLFAFKFHGAIESDILTGEGSLTLPLVKTNELFEKALPVLGSDLGYQDIFYTSVDKVGESPFFNWAEKSFIGDGFRYMGNIFGMPADNPFYTFTCYWCAISILWLIFDIVMYVPKLAHRWLDKGAIE